jgi:hypothetical protein
MICPRTSTCLHAAGILDAGLSAGRGAFLVRTPITKSRVIRRGLIRPLEAQPKILKLLLNSGGSRCVACVQGLRNLHGKRFKSTCVLCSAVAYCCGAVAPRAIAALLGRFLPRLGPLVHSSGPFFFGIDSLFTVGARHASSRGPRMCASHLVVRSRPGMTKRLNERGAYSAAAWNDPRSPSGTAASASANAAKSLAICSNRGPRSRRRSSI